MISQWSCKWPLRELLCLSSNLQIILFIFVKIRTQVLGGREGCSRRGGERGGTASGLAANAGAGCGARSRGRGLAGGRGAARQAGGDRALGRGLGGALRCRAQPQEGARASELIQLCRNRNFHTQFPQYILWPLSGRLVAPVYVCLVLDAGHSALNRLALASRLFGVLQVLLWADTG